MKFSYPAIFIATICLMWGIPSSARTTSYTANATNCFPPVRDNYVENPRFPGGEEACMKFIADNLRYPTEAEGKGIEGRVYVQFIIDSLGHVVEPRILKSPSPLLDEEALRIVRAMPVWSPRKIRGKAVHTKMSLPIMFRKQYFKTERQTKP